MTAVVEEMQVQDETNERPERRPGGELFVAGVLVQALPAREPDIRCAIAEIPGAMIHGAAAGKLVVTLEAASTAELAGHLSRLQDLPGVLSALPVYQHHEPVHEIDEEEVYGD